MESNPWKDISPKPDTIIPPVKVIEKIFSGLSDFSSKKVGFELKKVNYFPEEVTFTSPMGTFIDPSWEPKVNPHPDFGYNPGEEKGKELDATACPL